MIAQLDTKPPNLATLIWNITLAMKETAGEGIYWYSGEGMYQYSGDVERVGRRVHVLGLGMPAIRRKDRDQGVDVFCGL